MELDTFLRSLVDMPVAGMPAGWEELATKLAGGDLSVVKTMAELLDSELDDRADYGLVHQLYKWLVDHDHPKLVFQVIRFRHLIEGSSYYTAAELEAVLDCCDVYPAEALPVLYAIVMSDNSLFMTYKDRILAFIDKLMEQSTDPLTLNVGDIIRSAMRIEALKMDESDQEIFDKQPAFASSVSKDIASGLLNELESAATCSDYEELCNKATSKLELLERMGGDKELPFYKGLIALALGHYNGAYGFFQAGDGDKAKVGAAYCLVHGIGVSQDLEQARLLLDQVGQDGYVLYLRGISYYKEHTPAGTSKALELLADSLRLQYQPALEASLMIRYATLFEGDFSTEQLKSFVATQKGQVPDELLGGLAAHVAFTRALLHGQAVLKERPSIAMEQPDWMMTDEVFRQSRRELESYGSCSSLLYLYSKAKFEQLSMLQEDMEAAKRTVLSYNQSLVQRQRALDTTLLTAFVRGDEADLNLLLHIYKEFGGSLDDVLSLSTVATWAKAKVSSDFRQSVLDRLAERLDEQTNPLDRLLLAWLHATRDVSKPDLSLVLRCVKDITAESDDLCVTLRNMVVSRCGLSRDLPVLYSALQMPMASRRWLDQLIGYAFFMYNSTTNTTLEAEGKIKAGNRQHFRTPATYMANDFIFATLK